MILDSQGGRKHSSHPNRDTPPWQTSILMIVGFVVTTGNSPTPLGSAELSEAATRILLFCLPLRTYRAVVAGTCRTEVEMRNISETQHLSTHQTNTYFNLKDYELDIT